MKQLQQAFTGLLFLIFTSLRSAENNDLQVCALLPRELNKVILSLQDNFFYDHQKDLALIVKDVPSCLRNQSLFVAKTERTYAYEQDTIYHKDIPVRKIIFGFKADYIINSLMGLGPNKHGLCVMLKLDELPKNKHIIYKMACITKCCSNLASKRKEYVHTESYSRAQNTTELICLHPQKNEWVIKKTIQNCLEFFSIDTHPKLNKTVGYKDRLLFLKYDMSTDQEHSFIGVFKVNEQTQMGRYNVENDTLVGKDIFNIELEGYHTDNIHLEQSDEFSDLCLVNYTTLLPKNKTLLISLAQKRVLKIYEDHVSFLQPFDYCSKHKILRASLASKVLIPVQEASLKLGK